MPNPDDLRQSLHELAYSAPDVPDMPVVREVRSPRPHRTGPVLLAAALLVAGLVVSMVGTSWPSSAPLHPAAGPTRAVPPVTPRRQRPPARWRRPRPPRPRPRPRRPRSAAGPSRPRTR